MLIFPTSGLCFKRRGVWFVCVCVCREQIILKLKEAAVVCVCVLACWMAIPLCADGNRDHCACNWQTKIKLEQEGESVEWKWFPLDLLVLRLMWWDVLGLSAAEQLHSVILITSRLKCRPAAAESVSSDIPPSIIQLLLSFTVFLNISAPALCCSFLAKMKIKPEWYFFCLAKCSFIN